MSLFDEQSIASPTRQVAVLTRKQFKLANIGVWTGMNLCRWGRHRLFCADMLLMCMHCPFLYPAACVPGADIQPECSRRCATCSTDLQSSDTAAGSIPPNPARPTHAHMPGSNAPAHQQPTQQQQQQPSSRRKLHVRRWQSLTHVWSHKYGGLSVVG
jgi:hypothetical protein